MLKEFAENLDPSALLAMLGICLFGYWLFNTSLGRTALLNSKLRRNNMPVYFPPAVLLIWFTLGMISIYIADNITADMSESAHILGQTIAFSLTGIISASGTLVMVKPYFARGLKGFGLNFKKLFKDAFYAGPYLLAVWPVAIAMLLLTGKICKIIFGDDYAIQPHEEIELIRNHSAPAVRAAIFLSGTIIIPFFEEVVFRGLIQTTIRSYITKPWLSIVFASIIFAIFHAQEAHWPSIFILGMLFGYAYEKSGSLFRSIFIHMLFNGLTFLAVMSQN